MLQECKYRLPCNWCDKYDRMCEAVLVEIHKRQEEESIGRPEPKKCDHEWRFLGSNMTDDYYICNKCGANKTTSSSWMLQNKT